MSLPVCSHIWFWIFLVGCETVLTQNNVPQSVTRTRFRMQVEFFPGEHVSLRRVGWLSLGRGMRLHEYVHHGVVADRSAARPRLQWSERGQVLVQDGGSLAAARAPSQPGVERRRVLETNWSDRDKWSVSSLPTASFLPLQTLSPAFSSPALSVLIVFMLTYQLFVSFALLCPTYFTFVLPKSLLTALHSTLPLSLFSAR